MLFKDLVFLGVLPRMVANWKWKRENSSERSDKLVIVICQTSHWFGGHVWQLENLLGICWGYDECLKQVVWRSSRNKNIAIRWISVEKSRISSLKSCISWGENQLPRLASIWTSFWRNIATWYDGMTHGLLLMRWPAIFQGHVGTCSVSYELSSVP